MKYQAKLQLFPNLPANWKHLGSSKNADAYVPPSEIGFNWPGVWPESLKISPGDSNEQARFFGTMEPKR